MCFIAKKKAKKKPTMLQVLISKRGSCRAMHQKNRCMSMSEPVSVLVVCPV